MARRILPLRNTGSKEDDKIVPSVFCFRIRFRRSPRESLAIGETSAEVAEDAEGILIKISAFDADKSIEESEELVLSGCGYHTAESARVAGSTFRQGLALALARNLIGVDFRSRGPSSSITPAGLQHFASVFHLAGPVAEDRYGMSVHERLPDLHFIKMGDVNPFVKKPFEKVIQSLSDFIATEPSFSTAEEVAFEFFNASFFQNSADARFLLLMTAIETLIDPAERSAEARKHVDGLIAATARNDAIDSEERLSLEGSLRFLKRQSIRQAGKRVVVERLGDREYKGKPASKFFSDCYDLRSRLVHGLDPIPTWEEINQTNGDLERFVSDLLTVPWDQPGESA